MSLIQIQNLTFSYDSGEKPLFENVSLSIDTNWKLGLIGRNGRGKTTLLKLMHGDYRYQGGISASVSFEYFPYPISYGRLSVNSPFCKPTAKYYGVPFPHSAKGNRPSFYWLLFFCGKTVSF